MRNADDIRLEFERWCRKASKEGEKLKILSKSSDSMKDAFYRDLAFGTGGLRGVIGIGSNRMNEYTVAKATQGLANYLNGHFKYPSVVIARDSRHFGKEFSRVTAEVLAANGIRVFLYARIEPTPLLSFAVRDLNCSAGVCVTASHNPAEYNGYKVYGPDGCQITTNAAHEIQESINAVDIFDDVNRMPFDEAEDAELVSWISEGTFDRYIKEVLGRSCGVDCSELKVAYTPLHGAGLEPMRQILSKMGVVNLSIESAQAIPDGAFSTCPRPNPEEKEALQLGLKLAESEGSDILLASDPDADRLGVAVYHKGKYVLLNGNEVGMLLLDFLCMTAKKNNEDISKYIVITTVVSTPMADVYASDLGFELRKTLTGFKYIGEQIGLLEEQNRISDFLFGFEESYGFLTGSYVRDKDAMVAALLVCQAAAYYKTAGRDLVDALVDLYERYGYWRTSLISLTYSGSEGATRIESIMTTLRSEPPLEIAGYLVEDTIDYLPGISMPIINGRTKDSSQVLPSADVLEFRLSGGAKVIIRPSGTEPKIKAYISACGSDFASAETVLAELEKATRKMLR